ncbi:MAG: recombinase family protein [Clostridiales bacterium]|nr:recombinase family protein [Clostridiales bacterium]
MNKTDKRKEKQERKDKIRARYAGIDPSLLESIPPEDTEIDIPLIKKKNLRVAAYVRVSTDDENQTSSYELQINHYRDYVAQHDGWELVGIYADEGISGTSIEHRVEFNRLIADCEAGKIDLIITKSISRFARNTVDSLLTQRKLAGLKNPVGVFFETENLNSLEKGNDIIMTVLSATAQEESHVKSEIMVQSLMHRFNMGIFLTPELLGYDKDEDGNLVINEEEADTVRLMYYLFLSGFSTKDIAEILTSLRRETKLGNTVWSGGGILRLLQNERYCGDIISWKTYTFDYLEHKSKKNRGARPRKKQTDHHEGIVSHEEWNAAQRMIAAHKYGSRRQALPVLEVVNGGALHGFVPVNRSWTGFSDEDYVRASQSAYTDKPSEVQLCEPESSSPFDLSGYQVVSSQLFSTNRDPAMTISDDKIRFNTACLRRFEDVEYVELLLNTVEHCLAIRPCSKENPNAIRWGSLRENGRWAVLTKGCRGLARPLYSIMGWNGEYGYRMRGQFCERDGEKIMLFDLSEPEILLRVDSSEAEKVRTEITDVQENTIDGEREDEEREKTEEVPQQIKSKTITLCSPAFEDRYGDDADKVHLLERIKYSGSWDVLRPAAFVEGIQDFTADQVTGWLDKAQELMDEMRYAG